MLAQQDMQVQRAAGEKCAHDVARLPTHIQLNSNTPSSHTSHELHTAGTLDIRVHVDGTSPATGALDLRGQCGLPLLPRLSLRVPEGEELLAVVWKDNLNRWVFADQNNRWLGKWGRACHLWLITSCESSHIVRSCARQRGC